LVLVEFGEQGGLAGCQGLPGFQRDLEFRVEVAVGPNMQELMASLDQHAADEQAAMAMSGVFFAAQKRDTKLSHPAFQSLNAGQENGSGGSFAVQDATALVVEGVAFWAAAKLFAEKEVFDGGACETFLQGLPVELGRKF
jgi:hypothetical protein